MYLTGRLTRRPREHEDLNELADGMGLRRKGETEAALQRRREEHTGFVTQVRVSIQWLE